MKAARFRPQWSLISVQLRCILYRTDSLSVSFHQWEKKSVQSLHQTSFRTLQRSLKLAQVNSPTHPLHLLHLLYSSSSDLSSSDSLTDIQGRSWGVSSVRSPAMRRTWATFRPWPTRKWWRCCSARDVKLQPEQNTSTSLSLFISSNYAVEQMKTITICWFWISIWVGLNHGAGIRQR